MSGRRRRGKEGKFRESYSSFRSCLRRTNSPVTSGNEEVQGLTTEIQHKKTKQLIGKSIRIGCFNNKTSI